MQKKPNHSISCTVEQCKHNCQNEEFCSLDTVNIGTHESNPTMNQCVDCNSFELQQGKNV